MSTWTFFGRILPERVPVTWHAPLQGSAHSALGFAFDFRVKIHASQVILDLTITQGDAHDVPTLRNAAAEFIRGVTDLIGYKQGYYFDVEIVAAIHRDTDDWTVFGIEIPILKARREAQQINAIDGALVQAFGESVAAHLVLAEFREAMRVSVGTGLHCYRAIEAMMQSLKTNPGDADGPAWEALRNRLRVDRSAIDEVKQHADFPRHGKPWAMSDADRAKVFGVTDEIIERYLLYLVSGEAALKGLPVLAAQSPVR
jgi:hypothetical protein